MIHNETAVQHLEQQKLALEDVVRSVRVLGSQNVLVLLPNYQLALHDELVGRHRPALLHLGGEVEACGTEQERVDVTQRVPRVEALVVDDGRGYDLLPEAEILATQALDEVGEEDVDFVEVFGRLERGKVSLAAQLDFLLVQEPFLVVAGLPEVARHLSRLCAPRQTLAELRRKRKS